MVLLIFMNIYRCLPSLYAHCNIMFIILGLWYARAEVLVSTRCGLMEPRDDTICYSTYTSVL